MRKILKDKANLSRRYSSRTKNKMWIIDRLGRRGGGEEYFIERKRYEKREEK